MLNAFAFGTRTHAIRVIDRAMIVRNRRFVESRLRVTKANIHAPVSRQAAWTGSVPNARFTGWVEQEFGKRTSRNRASTLLGRGGSQQKQMRPSIRLKPGREVITPEDFGLDGNLGGFVAMLLRKRDNRIIRIKGSFYKRNRKRLQMVQKMEKVQPKRLRWMRRARGQYFAATDLDALWSRTCRALMPPPRL